MVNKISICCGTPSCSAVAAGRRRPPPSIDISRLHGARQKISRKQLMLSIDGTDRRKDRLSTVSQTLLRILCGQCQYVARNRTVCKSTVHLNFPTTSGLVTLQRSRLLRSLLAPSALASSATLCLRNRRHSSSGVTATLLSTQQHASAVVTSSLLL